MLLSQNTTVQANISEELTPNRKNTSSIVTK